MSYEAPGSLAARSPAASGSVANDNADLPAGGPVANNGVPVRFDDFIVEHEGISIVQHNDYYAFGAPFEQRSVAGLRNKYLYQGKEYQSELNLSLYDFHARQYDPLLGRMTSMDPLASSYYGFSPYVGMGSNPVMYVDPNGEFLLIFSLKYALIGAGIGGAAGGLIAKSQGKDFWTGFKYGAAIGFAVAGFAGSDFAKVNIWETHSSTGTPMFPNGGGILRSIEKIAPKGGAKFGRAITKKLIFDTPRLPQLPDLPGLDLPVSKLLEVVDPYINPPSTQGVSMVDQQTVFGNSVPSDPQIATGQGTLRNIASYLNIARSTGQSPQSISLSGIDTNFANRTYSTSLKQPGRTTTRTYPTSSILQGRLEFVQQELIRLGAPPNSVNISPSPTIRFGVNSSRVYFNYGN